MSPFQVMYGYLPPHLGFSSHATTYVAEVETDLKHRDIVIDLLKDALHKSQERMKFFANQKRTDKTFSVGDKVYLKLQPYRQTFVALRRNLKLAAKYYGPFTLKQHIGTTHIPSPALPVLDTDGQFLVIHAAALDSRTILPNGFSVPQILIQ
ncbi:uncharacterized protein LOC113296314 [Papaver somniferum]|uniref:uncharacterized protein LOC113296314 n=1 Tax=Papaver somniferum TaxID=3469 RepID=UPI000E6F8DF5|nr:uncharacterized protein LOC113296314 [Papaver somniferum]